MFPKWREHLKEGRNCFTLFMDLSTVFDTFSHDLSLAEFQACAFDHKYLSPKFIILSGQIFRTRIYSSYSPSEDLLLGVSQA